MVFPTGHSVRKFSFISHHSQCFPSAGEKEEKERERIERSKKEERETEQSGTRMRRNLEQSPNLIGNALEPPAFGIQIQPFNARK